MNINSHNLFSMEVHFNPNQLLITQNHPLVISHCSLIVKVHWHFIPAKYFFPILLDMTTRVPSLDFWESLKLSGSLSVTFYQKQEQQENGVEQSMLHASTSVVPSLILWVWEMIHYSNPPDKYFRHKSYIMVSIFALPWTGDILKVKWDYFVFAKFFKSWQDVINSSNIISKTRFLKTCTLFFKITHLFKFHLYIFQWGNEFSLIVWRADD